LVVISWKMQAQREVGVLPSEEISPADLFSLPQEGKRNVIYKVVFKEDDTVEPIRKQNERIADRFRAGESLSRALSRHGVDSHEVHYLAKELRKEVDLRMIQPGDAFVLEKRIDEVQDMGDKELGTFTRFDWFVLIVFAIVLPVIAVELAR